MKRRFLRITVKVEKIPWLGYVTGWFLNKEYRIVNKEF